MEGAIVIERWGFGAGDFLCWAAGMTRRGRFRFGAGEAPACTITAAREFMARTRDSWEVDGPCQQRDDQDHSR